MASDGLVDWDEFCTYLMLQFQENDSRGKSTGSTFVQKPNIVRIAHNKVRINERDGKKLTRQDSIYVNVC